MSQVMVPAASLSEPRRGALFDARAARGSEPVDASGGDAVAPSGKARYRAMVEAHLDAVWRALRGLGVPPAQVDDAAQHVFLIALGKLDAIDPGSERSFLLGTAVGIAANVRRSVARGRERPASDALVEAVDPGPDPEQAASHNERMAMLERILDGMPDDLRTVFVLFELEGLTSIEIGVLLGIPTGTATSRLRRARECFQSLAARVTRHREPAPRRSP